MIDLVLAVDDSLAWHRENLHRNPSHYSFLRYGGARTIDSLQKFGGGRIYYNTLVKINPSTYIKYGVISTDDLINDLLDWNTMYVSGRLHKPTLTLHQRAGDDRASELVSAFKINLQSALHAALLLLHERFTEEELFMTIAGLSYHGDFRMTFGEDRHKIAKLVHPQMHLFRSIYQPMLANDVQDLVLWSDKSKCFLQNLSTQALEWHMNLLPKNVQNRLCYFWLSANKGRRRHGNFGTVEAYDLDDLLQRLAYDISYRKYLGQALANIVFHSSWSQSLKGLISAGLVKSLVYSKEKVVKMVTSLTRSQ